MLNVCYRTDDGNNCYLPLDINAAQTFAPKRFFQQYLIYNL